MDARSKCGLPYVCACCWCADLSAKETSYIVTTDREYIHTHPRPTTTQPQGPPFIFGFRRGLSTVAFSTPALHFVPLGLFSAYARYPDPEDRSSSSLPHRFPSPARPRDFSALSDMAGESTRGKTQGRCVGWWGGSCRHTDQGRDLCASLLPLRGSRWRRAGAGGAWTRR